MIGRPDDTWTVEEVHRVSYHQDSSRVRIRQVVALELTVPTKDVRDLVGSDTEAFVYDSTQLREGETIVHTPRPFK